MRMCSPLILSQSLISKDLDEETCLLTQLGSGPDAEDEQFYSRQDYIDILKYADARSIQVIPEVGTA